MANVATPLRIQPSTLGPDIVSTSPTTSTRYATTSKGPSRPTYRSWNHFITGTSVTTCHRNQARKDEHAGRVLAEQIAAERERIIQAQAQTLRMPTPLQYGDHTEVPAQEPVSLIC